MNTRHAWHDVVGGHAARLDSGARNNKWHVCYGVTRQSNNDNDGNDKSIEIELSRRVCLTN